MKFMRACRIQQESSKPSSLGCQPVRRKYSSSSLKPSRTELPADLEDSDFAHTSEHGLRRATIINSSEDFQIPNFATNKRFKEAADQLEHARHQSLELLKNLSENHELVRRRLHSIHVHHLEDSITALISGLSSEATSQPFGDSIEKECTQEPQLDSEAVIEEYAFNIRQIRYHAATAIQNAFKNYKRRIATLARHLREIRSEAAINIQKTLRGYFGRKEAARLRQERLLNSSKNELRVTLRSAMIAHPQDGVSLSAEGTEDASFTDEVNQTFGVADGVSAWRDYGIDASLFPTELMENSKAKLRAQQLKQMNSAEVLQHLTNVLDESTSQTEHIGSSTAILAVLLKDKLHVASLGDSSFLLLRRRGTILRSIYRSLEQQHAFNIPFQLAHLPRPKEYPELVQKGFSALVASLQSETWIADSAASARCEALAVQRGDIVIAGSDGLFDNLFNSDIEKIANLQGKTLLAGELARDLAMEAVSRSRNPRKVTPFAKAAGKAGVKHCGGKADDITVIVGLIE